MTASTSERPVGRRAAPVRRIRDVLRARIVAGVYGDRPLPSEAELAADFATSRTVIREVLTLLRGEGLVDRIQGAGTFAISEKAVQSLDCLRGLAESFVTGHARVTNEVILAEAVPATSIVAERLGLSRGDLVVALERVRLLDGEPLSLDASYLPADIGLPLLDLDLTRHDVFALIESKLGLRLGEATISIEAIAADGVVAHLLRVPAGSPLLFFERLTYDEGDRPIDLEFVRYRGDRFSLAGRLQRERPHHLRDQPQQREEG